MVTVIKTFFKLLLCVVVYTIVFLIVNILMPFSPEFKELGATGTANPKGLLFITVNSTWICFTIYFFIRHTNFAGRKLFINILFMMFFTLIFMTQIETLLFIGAFPVLTRLDVFFIMLAGLIPLLATIPLLMKFFQNREYLAEKVQLNVKSIMMKLGIIGVIYLCVYMFFGYFVAWQFEELRYFYSGSREKLSFFGQLLNNAKTNPLIYPFQVLRGIMFGVFVLPLKYMITKNKIVLIISVTLVYLCTAIMLIIPNVLFPDMVRIGHFIEMTVSMLFFSIIVGNILWERKDYAP
jgi:hypothetical protein